MNTTIRKTVTIPRNHRLRLDVAIPARVPAGEAEVVVVVSPVRRRRRPAALAALAGCLAASPLFSRDPLALQKELRDEWE